MEKSNHEVNELLELARGSYLVGKRGRAFRYAVVAIADNQVIQAEVSAASATDAAAILKAGMHGLQDPEGLRLLEAIIITTPAQAMYRRGEIDLLKTVPIPSLAMDIGEAEHDPAAEGSIEARRAYVDARIPGEVI